MTQWIIPATPKKYRLEAVLRDLPYVDWRQYNNIQVGDIVYIYCASPISQIKYKMQVTHVNLTAEECTTDKEYWVNSTEFDTCMQHNKFFRMVLLEENSTSFLKLEDLQRNGLNAAPQGGLKAKQPLLGYIESFFNTHKHSLKEIIEKEIDFSAIREGALKSVLVNKYERDILARRACLAKHGYNCSVCGLNFEERYGEIGRNFIHVHHVVPISSIGQEYQIDPENDLTPVCPNCHAMLHKGQDGQVLTTQELKALLK